MNGQRNNTLLCGGAEHGVSVFGTRVCHKLAGLPKMRLAETTDDRFEVGLWDGENHKFCPCQHITDGENLDARQLRFDPIEAFLADRGNAQEQVAGASQGLSHCNANRASADNSNR
jgi:hypothetical protein